MAPPEQEWLERIRQSQRLLAQGHSILARHAGEIAHMLNDSVETLRNLELLRPTLRDTQPSGSGQDEQTQLTPVSINERIELLWRYFLLRVASMFGKPSAFHIPREYRSRLALAAAIVVAAVVLRVMYGRQSAPLSWLFTGVLYNRQANDGTSFTFMFSPGLGWLLLSLLLRFMMRRPGGVTRPPHAHAA